MLKIQIRVRMVVFPNAKINLGLYVTSKRPDGYHNIETVFHPIGLSDVLEVVEDPEGSGGTVLLTVSGIPVEGDEGSNLVVKAYRLLSSDFNLPSVRCYLHKVIPTGAGLGGGSSDGAHMLKVLNVLFNLGLEPSELAGYAIRLGSDCPFFLKPVPMTARGRGEELSEIEVNLRGYNLQLYHPGTGISTAEAYRHVLTGYPARPVGEVVREGVEGWKGVLVNAFEPYAFKRNPLTGRIRDELERHGAVYASMSGSGSAVYGLFRSFTDPPPSIAEYLIWQEEF